MRVEPGFDLFIKSGTVQESVPFILHFHFRDIGVFILFFAFQGLSQIPGCKIFMHPVKEKDFPNYYKHIQHPMDLSQIRMKINQNAYSTREEFLSDIRLIHDNSEKFNGIVALVLTSSYFSYLGDF